MTLGQRITELRERYNLSKAQLAEHTYISLSYVHQMEREEKVPNLTIIQRFADLFSMTMSEFLEDVEVDRG